MTFTMKTAYHSKKSVGFTIIELLVVIVIIGILAAIIIVSYGNVQAQARNASVQSDADSLDGAETHYALSKSTGGKTWYSKNGIDSDLDFTPSKGNIIDVVSNATDYCIRVYNPSSTNFKELDAAATKESTPGACSAMGPSALAVSDDSASREASFTPSLITGMRLGLNAKDINLGNLASVPSWKDESSGGRDATVMYGNPTLDSQSGRKYVVFGANDALSTPSIGVTGSQPRHIFALIRSDDYTGNILGWGVEGQGQIFDLWDYNSGVLIWHGYGGGMDTLAGAPPLSANVWHVIEASYDGTTVSVKVDGVGNSVVASINTFDSVFRIGTGTFNGAPDWTGDIAAVYVFDHVLSASDAQSMRDYLQSL